MHMGIRQSTQTLCLRLSGQKYYFVGLAATGNQTGGRAMSLLGYRWRHYPVSLRQMWFYDVVTDSPVGMWFRQGVLPRNGIFILTTRNVSTWLEDCQHWFESRPPELLNPFERKVRRYLYKGLRFDRHQFEAAYHEHVDACYRVACQMEVPLHEWNVVADPTWDFLQRLTGKETNQPFPFQPKVYAKTWQEWLDANPKAQ